MMQTPTEQSETQRTQGETCSAGERKASQGQGPGPPEGPRGPGHAPSGCVCSSRTWSGRSSRTRGRGTSSPRQTPFCFWGPPCHRRRIHWCSVSRASSGRWHPRGHRKSRSSQSDPDVSISGLLGGNRTQRSGEARLWGCPLGGVARGQLTGSWRAADGQPPPSRTHRGSAGQSGSLVCLQG